MLKTIKLRLYPNLQQREQIDININHCRALWNMMLEMHVNRYKNNKNSKFVNGYGMNLLLPSLKKEYAWLKEADSSSLQETNTQLETAYKRFFKKLGGSPKFKSYKFSRKSYTTKIRMSLIDDHHLKLLKLGRVYFRAKEIPDGRIKRVTVSISSTGKYHALVLMDTDIKPFEKTGKAIGIDLGLASLSTQSDGYKLDNIRFDKKLTKKKHYWEKRLARRRKQALQVIHEQHKLGHELELADFSNYTRAKYMVAKYAEKEKNQREDYLQKYTTNLVKKYDTIVMEDLKSSNMIKNHNLARAIANASWHKIREMLEYKTSWYGKKLIIIDPKYTSQVDFETGEVVKKPLDVRQYTNSLGHTFDRDINAAKNILKWGISPETRITK